MSDKIKVELSAEELTRIQAACIDKYNCESIIYKTHEALIKLNDIKKKDKT